LWWQSALEGAMLRLARALRLACVEEGIMRRQLPIAAAALVLASAANAAELPARKPGLWDMTMVFEGRSLPPQSTQQCVDAATDKLMTANFGNVSQEACAKRDIQNSGSTITVDSVCKFGPMTVTSHAVVTGSFDSAYSIKVNSKREGGPALPAGVPGAGGESTMTIAAKWLGPCKADQKPGDMIMPNGMKMNVLDMPKMPGTMPQR
jgi:Protein of unknown function (DUF3617)